MKVVKSLVHRMPGCLLLARSSMVEIEVDVPPEGDLAGVEQVIEGC